MSKYNSYARRVDEIARGLFVAYNKALAEYKTAEAYYAANKRPAVGIWNTDSEKIARAAEAELKYHKAKGQLEAAKNALMDGKMTIRSIQSEFRAEFESDMSINPSDLDMAAVEVLKSGILRPEEYSTMVARYANNLTMARMIASYAEKGLDNVQEREGRLHLLRAINESKKAGGGDRLESFDNICTIYERCARNPDIIPHWDEFTANMIANF